MGSRADLGPPDGAPLQGSHLLSVKAPPPCSGGRVRGLQAPHRVSAAPDLRAHAPPTGAPRASRPPPLVKITAITLAPLPQGPSSKTRGEVQEEVPRDCLRKEQTEGRPGKGLELL